MKLRTLVNISLASSLMLLAGGSLAMGPGGQGKGGGCGGGCDGGECATGLLDTPVIELSESAASELIKMREEEKLARDVYAALGEKWDSPVFKITNAEQKHMNAMKKMLDRFDMEDPITTDAPGEYTTQAFTDLYAKLVDSGSGSLLDALKVGAKIEELDLADLRVAGEQVEDPILTKVYGNLERATRNHLRAFAKQIQANGGTYEAEFLSQEEFDTIAASPMEKGMGGQAKGQGKGKGQGQGMGQGQGKNANKDCGLCDG